MRRTSINRIKLNLIINMYDGTIKKLTTSLLPTAGVLLLKKEEKGKALYNNTFPSLTRRGVIPEGA
jgi:hypothetical protein